MKRPPFVWFLTPESMTHNTRDTFHINLVLSQKRQYIKFPGGDNLCNDTGRPRQNPPPPYHVTDIHRFRSVVRVVVNTVILHFTLKIIAINSTLALNCVFFKQNLPVVI